jgi:hypothetical protein
MVLGFLLYEAADFTWHFGKLIYNGTKCVYDWYYEVPTQYDIEIDKLVIIEKKLDKLEHILEKDEFQKLLQKLTDSDGNEILKNKLTTDPKIDEI